MRRIARDKIIIRPRQRSGDTKSLYDKNLSDSIAEVGLLHPIVLAEEGEIYILIAGGRRLAAIDHLQSEKQSIICDRADFPPGEIPATLLHEITDEDAEREDLLKRAHRTKAELQENDRRLNLDWLDKDQALLTIYKIEAKLNPNKSIKDISTEIAAVTNRSPDKVRQSTQAAIKIMQHINDPAIRYARTHNEAYSLALKKEEAQLQAIIAKQTSALPSDIKLIEGDSYVELPKLDANSIDLILTDPPYGISAGDAGFRNRTVHHHNYVDDPEYARNFCRFILSEGFRIARSRANIFIFCDIDLFPFLKEASAQLGWTPFRTPVIWAKSDSEGLAPWGAQGPRRTYELLFYATKGQCGLVSSPVDILRHARVGRAERDYAAAKPVSLLKELISVATLPGATILDPCCGSGSALVAAKALKRGAVGIEKDKNAYNLAMAKLSSGETEDDIPPETELTSL